MARSLYLHIGTPKSATTYLQSLCAESASEFENAEIFLPSENRYSIVRDFLGKHKTPSDRGAWGRFVSALERHSGDALFSNEMFVTLPPGQIDQLAQSLPCERVKVIITARDLTRVVPSQWQTLVKNGSAVTWDSFSKAVCCRPPATDPLGWPLAAEGPTGEVHRRFWIKHDLVAIAKRWTSMSVADQLVLITIPISGADPTELARRFSEVIGLDLVPQVPMISPSNTSIGAVSAELMRRLNVDLGDADRTTRKLAFRDTLGKTVLTQFADDEPGIAVPEPQLIELQEVAATMVAELSDPTIAVNGDLAELLPSHDSLSAGVDPGTVTDIDLLEAAHRGLLGMIHEYAALAEAHPHHSSNPTAS